MIVAFIGFVGGWSQAVLGSNLWLAGVCGALVTAWFTFLPSFIFILAARRWWKRRGAICA
jgi:chromate transporter